MSQELSKFQLFFKEIIGVFAIGGALCLTHPLGIFAVLIMAANSRVCAVS